ncbi:hypothetical protein LTS15_007730 [Exophiala xenobiotica]|nr:hypothetical protein LTS15_007730 [Exophiala xenobiotica]
MHSWTVEETRTLLVSINALTDKDTPLTTDSIYKEFKHLSPQSLLTRTQISNKIRTFAKKEKVLVKELLGSWDQHRDQVQRNNDTRKRTRDESQEVGESNSTRSPSLKLRLVGKSAHPGSHCYKDQSESELSPPTSSGTQNPPDDDGEDEYLDCSERQSTVSGRINMQVEPWEHKLLSSVRGYLHSNIHDHPPDHEHIRDTLEKAREETEQGIKSFLLGRPPVRLTPSSMTEPAKELSYLLLREREGRRLETGLNTLYSGPGMTIELLLRTYAAAAVYRWVFLWSDERWDVPMPSEMYKILGVYEQLNQDLVAKLKLENRLKHLESVVKPNLPQRAQHCQAKLYEVFDSICVTLAKGQQAWLTAGPSASSTECSFSTRHEQQVRWEELLNGVFLDLLHLKLTMLKSSMSYLWRFPKQGDGFKAEWMKSAHDLEASIPEGSLVYVCLSPALFCSGRTSDARPTLVAAALVVVEGFAV